MALPCASPAGVRRAPSSLNALSGWLRDLGLDRRDLQRIYRTFNANADAFRKESERHDQ